MTPPVSGVCVNEQPFVSNSNIDNISDTINTRALILDKIVLHEEIFKSMHLKMTLTQFQGHRLNMKF